MDMLGKIRRMHLRDRLSLHQIAMRTGLARNTVRRWLREEEAVAPPHYVRRAVSHKLTPFHDTLTQALNADKHRIKQERRTGKALFAQIKAEGYTGSYSSVTDFIRVGAANKARRQRSCRWRSSWARRSNSTGAKNAW